MSVVSLERRQFLAMQYREVSADAPAVKDVHPLAQQIIIETALLNAEDAQAVADRELALRSVRRGLYEVTLPLSDDTEALDLGDCITLRHPRYGLAAGKKVVVLGVRPDGEKDEIHLTVWG